MVWCTLYVLDSIYPEEVSKFCGGKLRPLSGTSWLGSPYAANSILNTLIVAPEVNI